MQPQDAKQKTVRVVSCASLYGTKRYFVVTYRTYRPRLKTDPATAISLQSLSVSSTFVIEKSFY